MKKKKRSKAKGMYRDGDKLVIREGARAPGRCVICNKMCDAEPVDFIFGREKSHYVDVAAAQAVARAAGDLVRGAKYTGPVQVAVTLCSWHHARRQRQVGVGLGLVVLAAAYLLIRYSVGGAGEFGVFQISIYSVVAIVAGLAGVGVVSSALVDSTRVWFKPTKYYDRFVWVAGAGWAFLQTLPELEEYHYKPGGEDPNLTAEELIRRGEADDDD